MQTEVRKREIETLHQQNARVREALRGMLELALAIQENNPALFIPSLNYNQRVMAAKDALLDTSGWTDQSIELLRRVDHTLTAHGQLHSGTPLHDAIQLFLPE